MPQAVNIIVKDGAGNDKTFSLIAPAAGDMSQAAWALKEGAIATVFPRLTAQTSASTKGRNLKIKLRIPGSFTDASTGLPVLTDSFEMNVTFSVPHNFLESRKNDTVAYSVGLLSADLIKAMIRDAIPAT